ncbi:MAG: hypothetical protein WCG61_04085 [Chlorobium sp.]
MNNKKAEAFIGSALTHLDALLELAPKAMGGNEPLAHFWRQEGHSNPRIALFGPTGAYVPELLDSLTGLSLRESDLRESICEAVEPAVVRWLFEDGTLSEIRRNHSGASILQRHGESLIGVSVSGGLLNVNLPDDSMGPTDWVDRVSIPIIVTSSRASLGVNEVTFIRRLQKEGRYFLLLVTGIEGDPDQIAEIRSEIETFKIKPFMEEFGYFGVIYCNSDQSWINELSAMIGIETEKSHCLQIVFVVQRWLSDWSERLERLWKEEQKKRTQVNDIRMNLADVTARLMDIARRMAANSSLNITDLYTKLENTSDKTAIQFIANMSDPLESVEELLMPIHKAWNILDKTICGAIEDLSKSLDVEWNKEIDSFYEAYRVIVERQSIDFPKIQTKSIDAAYEVWQQLSFEKFSAHIINSLKEMQAKYKAKDPNETTSAAAEGIPISDKLSKLKDILLKAGPMSPSLVKLEYQVSSMVTEALRRYVRDRMGMIVQAIEEDTDSWFANELRKTLDAWRLMINIQLDQQLDCLKAEEYKGLLLPHKDAWRRLSLQAHSEI